MIGNYIGFFICISIVVLCIVIMLTDDKSTEGFGVGIFFVLACVVGTVFCINIIDKHTTYCGKYDKRIENVAEYKVDTTFITTNNATDTTYTIYFNGKEN